MLWQLGKGHGLRPCFSGGKRTLESAWEGQRWEFIVVCIFACIWGYRMGNKCILIAGLHSSSVFLFVFFFLFFVCGGVCVHIWAIYINKILWGSNEGSTGNYDCTYRFLCVEQLSVHWSVCTFLHATEEETASPTSPHSCVLSPSTLIKGHVLPPGPPSQG